LLANSASNLHEGELQIADIPSQPFQMFHVDHFGPIHNSSNSFKHILIVIDLFSRYTWLYPTKSTKSKETIKHLFHLFQNFNPPVCLVSDRGTAFTSQEFAEFLNSYNIVHRQVAVAALWANGLVERLNRFLKSFLKKVVEDTKNRKVLSLT